MTEEKKSIPEFTQGCFAIAVAVVTVIGGLVTWYVKENYSITPIADFSPYGTWSAGTKAGAEDCSLALVEKDTFTVEIYEGEFKGMILKGKGYFLDKKKTYGNLVGAFYSQKSKPIIVFGVVNITVDKQLTISASEIDLKKVEKNKNDIGEDISKLKKYSDGIPLYTKGFFKYDKDAPSKPKPNDTESK